MKIVRAVSQKTYHEADARVTFQGKVGVNRLIGKRCLNWQTLFELANAVRSVMAPSALTGFKVTPYRVTCVQGRCHGVVAVAACN